MVRQAPPRSGLRATIYWGELVAVETAHRLGVAGLAGDLIADGAFGSRTAALSAPYADRPDTCGHAYLTAEQIRDHVVACTRAGLQAGFHCIGDAALENIREASRRPRGSWVPTPSGGAAPARARRDAVARDDRHDGRLGIVASVQPMFDALWGGPDGMYAARLGERWRGTNPFRALATPASTSRSARTRRSRRSAPGRPSGPPCTTTTRASGSTSAPRSGRTPAVAPWRGVTTTAGRSSRACAPTSPSGTSRRTHACASARPDPGRRSTPAAAHRRGRPDHPRTRTQHEHPRPSCTTGEARARPGHRPEGARAGRPGRRARSSGSPSSTPPSPSSAPRSGSPGWAAPTPTAPPGSTGSPTCVRADVGLEHGVALPVWDALLRGEADDLAVLAQKASAGSVRFRLPDGTRRGQRAGSLPRGRGRRRTADRRSAAASASG